MKGLAYDIIVGIFSSVAGGYIYVAVRNLFETKKKATPPEQDERR